MNHRLWHASPALLLAGCPAPTYCPGILEVGVVATVIQDDFTPVQDATVTYSIAEGEERACAQTEAEYLCGLNGEVGRFDLRVQLDDHEDSTTTVDVEPDPCQTIGEFVTLLVGPPCSLEVLPSAIVSVTSTSGQAVPDASVTFSSSVAPEQPCTVQSDDLTWHCGEEVAGTLSIGVIAPQFQAQTQSIDVTEGPCHVDTVSVPISLLPSDE